MRAAWALRMAQEAPRRRRRSSRRARAADRDKVGEDQAEARFVIGETLVAQ